MEGTCKGDCKFGELFKCREECPNFIQTWWNPLDGSPEMVNDCAPRRTLLMMQGLFDRQIALQKSLEEQRNESARLAGAFAEVLVRLGEVHDATINSFPERKVLSNGSKDS